MTDLLFGSDVQSQVCAVGALLNILGPDYGEFVNDPRRVALRKMLENALVLGLAFQGVFGPDEDE